MGGSRLAGRPDLHPRPTPPLINPLGLINSRWADPDPGSARAPPPLPREGCKVPTSLLTHPRPGETRFDRGQRGPGRVDFWSSTDQSGESGESGESLPGPSLTPVNPGLARPHLS